MAYEVGKVKEEVVVKEEVMGKDELFVKQETIVKEEFLAQGGQSFDNHITVKQEYAVKREPVESPVSVLEDEVIISVCPVCTTLMFMFKFSFVDHEWMGSFSDKLHSGS